MSYDRRVEEIWESAPEVSLNDLPQYSRWPARMLGLEEWKRDKRTPEDIEREFERETYAPQYEYLLRHPEIVDHRMLHSRVYPNSQEIICTRKNKFRKLSIAEAHQMEAQLVAKHIASALPAPAVVELGAGSGRICLCLANDERMRNTPIIALEKMESGRKIIQTLAHRKNLDITVGPCDLASFRLTDIRIPEGSIIYTNIVWYILHISAQEIVDRLLQLKPKIVFHFEPFGCFYDCNTMYGQLCSSYSNANKYNMKYGNELREMGGKEIHIMEEECGIFGNNPYLPVSLISWVQKYSSVG
jgi:hypothetical protein